MTYHVYTSDAFVITSRPSKDADVSVLVFTEEYGLLYAIAKSARQLRSKQKYALQSLSYSSISLVKGREVWRITSVKKYISLYDKRIALEFRTLFARILASIDRFCPREQKEPEIFALLKHISAFVFKDLSGETTYVPDIPAIECYFLLNMFYELGYVTRYQDELPRENQLHNHDESSHQVESRHSDKQHQQVEIEGTHVIGTPLSHEILAYFRDPLHVQHVEKIIEKAIRESHL